MFVWLLSPDTLESPTSFIYTFWVSSRKKLNYESFAVEPFCRWLRPEEDIENLSVTAASWIFVVPYSVTAIISTD